MPNPATTADVAARWRPLSATETEQSTKLLAYAWAKLKKRIPDLEARLSANEEDLQELVVGTLVSAVLRVMVNPEGVRQGSEALDDYSTSFMRGDAYDGMLSFTDEEIDDLILIDSGHDGRAFHVDLLAGH